MADLLDTFADLAELLNSLFGPTNCWRLRQSTSRQVVGLLDDHTQSAIKLLVEWLSSESSLAARANFRAFVGKSEAHQVSAFPGWPARLAGAICGRGNQLAAPRPQSADRRGTCA